MMALPRRKEPAPGFGARIAGAARACAHVSNRSAILVEPASVSGHDLASVLMGLGIEVHYGPHAPFMDNPPLLLIGPGGMTRPATRHRLALARGLHPGAAICAVTGALTQPAPAWADPVARYDDARACLLMAGIGFVSAIEVDHAAEA